MEDENEQIFGNYELSVVNDEQTGSKDFYRYEITVPKQSKKSA